MMESKLEQGSFFHVIGTGPHGERELLRPCLGDLESRAYVKVFNDHAGKSNWHCHRKRVNLASLTRDALS